MDGQRRRAGPAAGAAHGPYIAHLSGTGPYALRLRDLGPRPPGYEAEPNDDEVTATPLTQGATLTGDFQSGGGRRCLRDQPCGPDAGYPDADRADDGTLAADLVLDGGPTLTATVAPDAPLGYSATLPAGRHLLRLHAQDEGLSGRYTVRLDPYSFGRGGASRRGWL